MKILIAPLDWGLGHTTRCVPLIRYLVSAGHEVCAAAEGASAKLLAAHFPQLELLPLQGYGIRYSKTRAAFAWRMLQQVPRILSSIRREHQWLAQLLESRPFDLVISDNRYGLYHASVPSVILTHQLQIQSGISSAMDHILRRWHYKLLDHFDACWVVDEPVGYSGRLAHSDVMPGHASYIGLLSQFSGQAVHTGRDEPGRCLLLLSGPEPMRTLLEQQLLQQAARLPQFRFIMAGGNPLGKQRSDLSAHITYYTHLSGAALQDELERAAVVVCRSGYSTIMDLALLQKKAVLIPTPGQTEQEYLASRLAEQGVCCAVRQEQLDLAAAITDALSRKPLPLPSEDFSRYMDEVVRPFLENLERS